MTKQPDQHRVNTSLFVVKGHSPVNETNDTQESKCLVDVKVVFLGEELLYPKGSRRSLGLLFCRLVHFTATSLFHSKNGPIFGPCESAACVPAVEDWEDNRVKSDIRLTRNS